MSSNHCPKRPIAVHAKRARASLLFALPLLFSLVPGCAADGDDADDDTGDVDQDSAELKTLPSFEKMWSAYPNGDAPDVKRRIGGAVDADWVTNTCVIRVSHALNVAGFKLPRAAPGLSTLRGGGANSGFNYGYRVSEFEKYLNKTMAPPLRGKKSSDFAGKKGIIVYKVAVWTDATGHFDLWDGKSAAHEDYSDLATDVFLWEAPGSAPGPAPAPPDPGWELRTDNDLCLDIDLQLTTAGARLLQYKCTGTLNQRFDLQPQTGGLLKLQAMHSKLCLEADTTRERSEIRQQPCNGSSKQLWRRAGVGNASFANNESGLFLDVPANTRNTVPLMLWKDNGHVAQRFYQRRR